jgi:serine/threonine-protein phosphatase 2A activator
MTTNFSSFPQVDLTASFSHPTKQINSDADVIRFNNSVAFDRIVGFIHLLNESVKGKSCTDADIHVSSTIGKLGDVLDVLNSYIDGIPPSTGPRRFGNIAFREWVKKMEQVRYP